jgi:hypothetical protein
MFSNNIDIWMIIAIMRSIIITIGVLCFGGFVSLWVYPIMSDLRKNRNVMLLLLFLVIICIIIDIIIQRITY